MTEPSLRGPSLRGPKVRERLSGPLVRVLDWMLSHRDDATGALICPVHGIEHTGKSAGAIVLAIELAKHAAGVDRDRMFAIAKDQCERLVQRLEREPDSTCFTFRPGRHDPYNCSNSVIDGGACSDALASCVIAFGDRLTSEERERFRHASVLHAQTYLRYAIVDKGVPAQCAWAMTGAAQAYRVSDHEVLRYVCEVGAERIATQQRGDGSFPYHPHEWGAGHPGASDASAYYQSRVNAFQSFALEAAMGERGVELDTTFARGVDFLHGLTAPDGIKTGAIEAKPWYWGAEYEVASHPFDIAAYATEWRRTRAPRAALALRASWRAWLQHLGADGRPASHRPAGEGNPRRIDSYQCPFFWAAHACWIARALPELEQAHSEPDLTSPTPVGVTHFADTDLARIDTQDLVAWVRGRRPAGNRSHGSPKGGGLVRVFSRGSGKNLFVAFRFVRRPTAAWSGTSGLGSFARGMDAGKEDLRFSAWLARNRWRAGDRVSAASKPLVALRRSVIDFGSPAVSTAFDRSSALEILDDGVRLTSPFAFRNGDSAGGSATREFRIGKGGELEIEEACTDASGVRSLWFRPPKRAVVLEESKERVRYRFVDPTRAS